MHFAAPEWGRRSKRRRLFYLGSTYTLESYNLLIKVTGHVCSCFAAWKGNMTLLSRHCPLHRILISMLMEGWGYVVMLAVARDDVQNLIFLGEHIQHG